MNGQRTSGEALLSVRDLRLWFAADRGDVRAVDGVSFELRAGRTLAIVGESGSGKTSLALALLRLLPRNTSRFDGHIQLGGADCIALSDGDFRERVRWRQVSMVFQGAAESLNPIYRVGHQIREVLTSRGGLARAAADERAHELLDMVRLPPEIFSRYPHELSGGMKQRIAVASALALDPSLVLLDEPTSALDVGVQAQIMNLFKRLKSSLGIASIFVSHDIALASDLADDIGVMYAGRLVEIGPSEEVLSAPSHPYTQKLLAAMPRLRSDAPLEYIPGAPPDLTALPVGCRFHPRCELAMDRCRTESPPDIMTASGQSLAACWLLDDESGPSSS